MHTKGKLQAFKIKTLSNMDGACSGAAGTTN
jgi:hypothetical protein